MILKESHNLMNFPIKGILKKSNEILTKSDKQEFNEYKKVICVGKLLFISKESMFDLSIL